MRVEVDDAARVEATGFSTFCEVVHRRGFGSGFSADARRRDVPQLYVAVPRAVRLQDGWFLQHQHRVRWLSLFRRLTHSVRCLWCVYMFALQGQNFEVSLHVPGSSCCDWRVRMERCVLTMEGPNKVEHFRETTAGACVFTFLPRKRRPTSPTFRSQTYDFFVFVADLGIDMSSRLHGGDTSVVSLILQDMTDFDSVGVRDVATNEQLVVNPMVLNHTTWLVLDGDGLGRRCACTLLSTGVNGVQHHHGLRCCISCECRYSGTASLANADWNAAELCVEVAPGTGLTNIMFFSGQATPREVILLLWFELICRRSRARFVFLALDMFTIASACEIRGLGPVRQPV